MGFTSDLDGGVARADGGVDDAEEEADDANDTGGEVADVDVDVVVADALAPCQRDVWDGNCNILTRLDQPL